MLNHGKTQFLVVKSTFSPSSAPQRGQAIHTPRQYLSLAHAKLEALAEAWHFWRNHDEVCLDQVHL
jgi:hypothetical protein